MNIEPLIKPTERRFIILWSIILSLIFIWLAFFSGTIANQYRQEAAMRRNARIDSAATEPGRTPAEAQLPPSANPRQVKVGFYLDGIASISILESNWSPVFYIWFRWTDDDINPGETFQIIDGEITEKKKFDEQTVNGEHYTIYFVRAKITKFFTTLRFPVDDHLMTLAIEDEKMSWNELEYITDIQNSNIGSRVKIPGYIVQKTGLVMKPHTYKTNFGDPLVTQDRSTYSQLIYWVWNVRPGLGPYLKIFIGLFAAILISLLSCFIKPTDVDPRFGLGVGAFFGAVANMLLASSLMPENGSLTLMDMVNGIGILVIFLSLVQSTISLYIYDILGRTQLSRLFDRVSFVIFAMGAIIINILIPMMGMTRI